MEDDWLKENMLTILSVISGVMLLCVAAIFVLYFVIKRKIKKDADQ